MASDAFAGFLLLRFFLEDFELGASGHSRSTQYIIWSVVRVYLPSSLVCGDV